MSKVGRIDKRKAVSLLRRAVREKGADYKYKHLEQFPVTCVYFDPKTRAPSCIVGHVMSYVGVEAGDVIKSGGNTEVVDSESVLSILNLTDGAMIVLREAQSLQDGGDTWGVALREALAA